VLLAVTVAACAPDAPEATMQGVAVGSLDSLGVVEGSAGAPGGGSVEGGEPGPQPPPPDASTRVFEGAWFEVAYPADFAVRPSLESSSADGFDSAFFDSPDGQVTFYVFSPQWGGEPVDIALDPGTEMMADSTSTTEGPVTTTRFTIRALDGSWERSYVTEEDERGPTRWTIGWRYSSQEARERYAPAFEAFRESLMQFGD
jgi:hypothetical protein